VETFLNDLKADIIEQLPHNGKYIFVLDGYTPENEDCLLSVAFAITQLQSVQVHVSSLGYNIDTRFGGEQGSDIYHYVSGWELDEYISLCEQEPRILTWLNSMEEASSQRQAAAAAAAAAAIAAGTTIATISLSSSSSSLMSSSAASAETVTPPSAATLTVSSSSLLLPSPSPSPVSSSSNSFAPDITQLMQNISVGTGSEVPSASGLISHVSNDEHIAMLQLCHKKFFIAGASARWFLNHNFKEVEEFLVFHFLKVCDQKEDDKPSSHHLVFKNDKGLKPVSPYVLRKLNETKTSNHLFQKLVSHVMSKIKVVNPSLRGWLFEGAVFSLLDSQSAIFIKCLGESKSSLKLSFGEMDHFLTIPSIQFPQSSKSLWLVPMESNQGGFDFAHLEREKSVLNVTFLQVTLAKTHLIKWSYMLQLLARICGHEYNTPRDQFLRRASQKAKGVNLQRGQKRTVDDEPRALTEQSFLEQKVAAELDIIPSTQSAYPRFSGGEVRKLKVTLVILKESKQEAEFFVIGKQDVVHRDFRLIVGSVDCSQ
jgi:hypothetical protein